MTIHAQIINAIKALADDATYYISPNGDIHVNFEDFEGFNENWDEVEREYDNPKAVEKFQSMLARECNFIERNYYTYYYFNKFKVVAGYASYDI